MNTIHVGAVKLLRSVKRCELSATYNDEIYNCGFVIENLESD